MKFALIGPVYPFRGGIAHYTTMLCRALRERGHDVLLVSFKRQYPRWLFPGRSDRDPSKKPLKVEGARYWIDSLNPITWLMAFWRIHRYQPDAIILQWWTTFWTPVWCMLEVLNHFFLQRPLLFICHNVLPHETRLWDSLLAKSVLRWGTRFTVQSVEEERRLLCLLPGVQTTVVPLPVFDMLVDHRVPKETARKCLGLPMDAPVLLFFGIVREYKGLQDLLAALSKVQAQMERVILLVAGEFWDNKQPYLEMIRRLGIENSVIVDDRYIPNEEVGIYFSAADVLVAPYRQVTGSAIVQMAQAFGVPVVTTHIGQAPGSVNDKTRGRIPPGNSEALAMAIVDRLVKAPQEMVAPGIQGAQQWTTWRALINVVEDVASVHTARHHRRDEL